uniref:Major capsid protein C-terminal domain-containing protein n=1 Tax=viral metagenome TaxID=1070528 RepID=A0A6C0K3C9_9ZZZZ
MGGGLMQLVAYGAQDVYLTGNPQITFWKVTYRRYTNFAIESIEQTFNGQADFGRRVTCIISRNGDLAYRTYLQVTLPEINQLMGSAANVTSGNNAVYARWLDYPGEQLIAQVEVEIGGQRIDRQYGDWMHIWNQLTMTAEQQRGYFKMIGNTTQLTFITDPSFADVDGPCDSNAPRQVCAPRNALPETTLYIPLQFWFCTNPGLALPLIALQYHEVKINLDIRPIDECLWAVTTLSCNTTRYAAPGARNSNGVAATVGNSAGPYANSNSNQYAVSTPVSATIAYNQSLVAASLYVDYVFLDTDERRRFAQNPHEYLITQLQFTGDESVGSSSNKIKLNFNHPVKELIWVVQPDQNVDYCSSLLCGGSLFSVLGAQPFNYTDAIDALPNAIHSFGGPSELAGQNAFIDARGLFQDAGALDEYVPPGFTGYWHGGVYNNSLTEPHFGGSNTPNANGLNAADAANSAAVLASLGLSSLSQLVPSNGNYNQGSSVSDAGTFVLSETSLDMHCWGQNPVVVAKLQLNGQDRFSEREGSYFSWVQPYQCHTRSPDEGINVYSFALRPEEHQPSGTCNFSRIDNATLQLVLSNATVEGTRTAKVRVYATNYNVLRIMSGMGGLAYSN